MKRMLPTTQYYFSVGGNQLDFTMYPDFDPKRVLAVINTSIAQTLIYATGGGPSSPTGGVFSGTLGAYYLSLTFNCGSAGMSDTDILQIIYDESVGTEEAKASIDIVSGKAGLDVNLLNSSFGGTLGDVMPAPFQDNALSIGILSGGVLEAPAMNMNNELIVDVTQSGTVPISGSVTVLAGSVTVGNFPATQPISSTDLTSINAKLPTLGNQAPSASQSTVISDSTFFSGPTGLSAVNIDLLTGSVNGWYDVKSFRMASIQTITTGTVTSASLFFEQTNDNTNTTGIAVPYVISGNSLGNVGISAFAVTNNAIYDVALTARYFRLRISVAVVGGGSVKALVNFNQSPYTPVKVNVVQPTAATLATTVSGTVTSTVALATLSSTTVADIASAAITSTITSANLVLTGIQSISVLVSVSVVSGTVPTLDIVLQETLDGTNYYDIYHFPRITATGQYTTPLIKVTGIGYRAVRTVTGTTPSFTMSLVRISRQVAGTYNKSFINRAIDPNVLNSVSSSYITDGCDKIHLCVSMAAGGTISPIFKVQGSEDQISWYDLGTATIIAAPSSSLAIAYIAGIQPKFARAIVATAGSGAVLNQVSLKGMGN